MKPEDHVDIPPGQYYLVEHQAEGGPWRLLICRNRLNGRMEVLSVVVDPELEYARRQAFLEIEGAAWDQPGA